MLEQLYQGLYNDGSFTGSFEDFQRKMQNPEYRKKLHAGIVDDGDFTGDFTTFETKFKPLDYDPKASSLFTAKIGDQSVEIARHSTDPEHEHYHGIDFVEDGRDLTKIRPIGEAEIRTEEAELVPELERMYGHLGFDFDEAGIGDYVRIKHKDDSGKGVRIAVDQWTSMGNEKIKKKANDYLTEWSKYATKEDIEKTYAAHERVGKIIELREQPLTTEEETDIMNSVNEDMDRTGTLSKISDFFQVMSTVEKVRYASGGSITDKWMSSLYDWVSTATDPNSEAVKEATKYWQTEKQKDPDLVVTEEMISDKTREIKIKQEKENIAIGKINDYLSDLDWEAEDYYEQIAEEKLERINTQVKANDKNLQKIQTLNNTYLMDIQEYNKLYQSVIERAGNGEQISEAEIQILDDALTALREKEDFVNKVKAPFVDLFIKQQDAAEEVDYLDNVNHLGLNMLLSTSTAAVDLTADLINFKNMLTEYAHDRVLIPSLSAITGQDSEVIKNSNWFRAATIQHQAYTAGADYLKGVADKWETHKKKTTKGYVNFADAAEKGILGFFENLPQIALAAYTGGGSVYATMGVYGLSGAGSKFHMMQEEMENNPNIHYTPEQMILAPISHGAFESVTMVPEMLMLRGVLKNRGKFDGKDKLEGITTYDKIGNAITGFGGMQALEISQEVTTQIGQNATDKFILGKSDVHMSDGLNADFFIKTIGSTGTFYVAPRALSGMLMMSQGMYLTSDQEAMNKSSVKLLEFEKGIRKLTEEITAEKDPGKKEALKAKLSDLETQRLKETENSSQIYKNIFDRFGEMDIPVINKLRTLAKQSAELRLKAKEIRENDNLSNGEKKNMLERLRKEFESVEGKKATLINNKNKYKLEHGNRINSLEKQALNNLREKNKGKEPTREQIEKEAERIFDEGNYNSDARVNEAKNYLKDELRRTASEVLINGINTIDPTKPIEKFEGKTLEEAVTWLRQALKDKGLTKTEIKQNIDQLKADWETGTVSIFQPKIKGKKVNPDTHEFDKHQIVVVNTGKSAKDPRQFTARGHDIFHAVVWKAFKASGKGFQPMAESLLKRIASKDAAGFEWLMGEISKITAKGSKEVFADPQEGGRMVQYIDNKGNPTEAYYEEVLMAISDGMRRGQINTTTEAIAGLKSGLSNALKSIGIGKENENLLIQDAQDMLNVIYQYGRGLDRKGGQMSSAVQKLVKGKVEVAPDIAPKKQTKADILSKQAMDVLSESTKDIIKEAKAQIKKVAAKNVNDAYQSYVDGKIGSWDMLQVFGEQYEPMFKNAIKQFENENNITFGESEIDTFLYEALHSSRGVKGSLLPDPSKPNKVIFDPNVQVEIDGKMQNNTPAKYLNGLLPQRMIEFAVKAIPNLEEYYAEDISTLKDLEDKTPSKRKEQHKPREQRDLNEIDIVTKSVVKRITEKLGQTIERALTLNPEKTVEDILNIVQAEIEAEYYKIILAEMGEIHSEGDRVVPSEEYKSFFDNNFDIIWKGLPIATIKKKYSSLFNIVQVGRELTPQGNAIFDISPISKAKFGSYFLNGKLTTLRHRRKSLATEIAQSLAKDAAYKLAKTPEFVQRIEDLQGTAGFSSVVGVQNEINEIGNQLDKKKGEEAKFDEVKWSKDFARLNDKDKRTFFDGLKSGKFLKAYIKHGGNMTSVFETVYPGETFGGKRKAIIKDIQSYMTQYDVIKKKFEKADVKIPKTAEQFITNELGMMDIQGTLKTILGLSKGAVDFRDPKQIHKVRLATIEIARKLGIEKAQRFLRFLYASGKIGATKTIYDPELKEYLQDAEFDQKKINKLKASLAKAKAEKKPAKTIKAWKKKIVNAERKAKKELEVTRYGLFAGKDDFVDFVLSGLKGYKPKYKSKIENDTRQSVTVVNKDFNINDNSKSAKRNRAFLKELMEIMDALEKDNVISKNDIGMIMMSLAGDMNTPLAAAAQVKYMTDDGKKSSDTHIYEHLIPRKVIGMYLASYAIGKTSESDINALLDDFTVAIIPKDQAGIVDKFFKHSMPSAWSIGKNALDRYFNLFTFGDINMELVDLTTGKLEPKSVAHAKAANAIPKSSKQAKDFGKVVINLRKLNKPIQGMSAWDFDDTIARTKSGVIARIPNQTGEPQTNRKVIFLAGGAGSGKSNVVKQLGLEKQGFKIVNQDISLEWLKKNSGLPADMRDLTSKQLSQLGKMQWEARKIAARKQMKFKGKGSGIIVDGTGGSMNVMNKQVQEFKDAGYDVHMIFVETSLDIALERNRLRKERSLKDIIVKKNHEAVQNNKESFRTLFGDNFAEVNTDNLKVKDPMPSKFVNKVSDFSNNFEIRRLTAEEFAVEGATILDQGGEFNFGEFDVVTEGEKGPLWGKAMGRAKKYGLEDNYILTARPHAAKVPIYEFLKSQGLNIPLENIITLENSTSEAKALWIAKKVGEGYNDIYFADDALQNVQAVDNMLKQFDVKGKVQQAKSKQSKDFDSEFNKILEDVTGIESKKRFSAIKARKRGSDKGKFRFFIPPSHEDFVGLLYNFMGKGKKGNQHRDFFEQALIRPLNRAYRELNTAKQSIANDYKSLNKEFENVKKKLTKKTPDGDFTYQDAIRVYLFDKHGHKVPGLTKTDQQKLVDLVMGDPELQTYAETLNVISKQDAYVNPTESWEAGDIRTDLDDATGRVGREQFFTEFFENTDIIFSQENLNKIEAAYGEGVVSAIKDILYRTKTGRNRPSGQNKLVNQFLNYLNGSVASTMFFNIRSAVLQQMSMVNFINFADNNIFKAAKAFANQKQYWADWATIFNSDFMKQRRKGIKTDVNGAELAATVKDAKNPIQAAIKKLLELGFLPTQIGDNIAIATGGATYYRNKINTYLKQGLSKKEAESKAWTDFQVLAEATQQSARPDMVSQQQASPLGKVILAFQNVTSQFNRLGKKAFLDIKNRRISPEYKNAKNPQLQSDISNLSRIGYYFAMQNLIFYSLQSALFMAMFDDDDEDERWLKKKERVVNGSIDSVLRGTGVWGAAVSTLKNMAIKWHEQREKGYNADESAVLMEMLNVSPPLGIKARKLVNAEKTLNYNKKVIDEMETFDIDNPQWSAVTNYVEATTNVPLNRLYNKTQNVRASLDNQHNAFERALMFSGWSQWNLGIEAEKKEKKKKTKRKSLQLINTW